MSQASIKKMMDEASNSNTTAVSRFLHQEFIPIDSVDEHGNTMLMNASLSGNHEMVLFLLGQSPALRINLQNHNGYTALMCAASRGFANIVRTLAEHRPVPADVDLVSKNGSTALDVAKTTEVRQMLRQYGAKTRLSHEGVMCVIS